MTLKKSLITDPIISLLEFCRAHNSHTPTILRNIKKKTAIYFIVFKSPTAQRDISRKQHLPETGKYLDRSFLEAIDV